MTKNAENMLRLTLEVCDEHLSDSALPPFARYHIKLVRASIIAAAKARGIEIPESQYKKRAGPKTRPC